MKCKEGQNSNCAAACVSAVVQMLPLPTPYVGQDQVP